MCWKGTIAKMLLLPCHSGPQYIALCATLLLLARISFAELQFQRCFLPNGTDINTLPGVSSTGYYYAPCLNFLGVQSMCCATHDHTCTTDGLCYSTTVNAYFRDACVSYFSLGISLPVSIRRHAVVPYNASTYQQSLTCCSPQTDLSWQDPVCTKLFVDGAGNGNILTPISCSICKL